MQLTAYTYGSFHYNSVLDRQCYGVACEFAHAGESVQQFYSRMKRPYQLVSGSNLVIDGPQLAAFYAVGFALRMLERYRKALLVGPPPHQLQIGLKSEDLKQSLLTHLVFGPSGPVPEAIEQPIREALAAYSRVLFDRKRDLEDYYKIECRFVEYDDADTDVDELRRMSFLLARRKAARLTKVSRNDLQQRVREIRDREQRARQQEKQRQLDSYLQRLGRPRRRRPGRRKRK